MKEALLLPAARTDSESQSIDSSLSLKSLGKNRSPYWLVPLIGASIALGAWTGVSANRRSGSGFLESLWHEEPWLGVSGIVLLLLTVLVWWLAGRNLGRPAHGKPLKITYLKDNSKSRTWTITYYFSMAAAVGSSVLLAAEIREMWGLRRCK